MPDDFASFSAGLDSPASRAAVVSPNDGADLATDARGLLVTASGNIRLITTGGDDVTIQNLIAPIILPIRTRRVYATSTTVSAGNIIALR
jgi:hypothetical protein